MARIFIRTHTHRTYRTYLFMYIKHNTHFSVYIFIIIIVTLCINIYIQKDRVETGGGGDRGWFVCSFRFISFYFIYSSPCGVRVLYDFCFIHIHTNLINLHSHIIHFPEKCANVNIIIRGHMNKTYTSSVCVCVCLREKVRIKFGLKARNESHQLAHRDRPRKKAVLHNTNL